MYFSRPLYLCIIYNFFPFIRLNSLFRYLCYIFIYLYSHFPYLPISRNLYLSTYEHLSLSLTPRVMKPIDSMPHSQGLSNNPHSEPNKTNSSYWYLYLLKLHSNRFKYHAFAPTGRFQLELIYLYFPASFHLTVRWKDGGK